MTLETLEAEILALPKDSQALLLSRLLKHLGQSEDIDQDIATDWAEEAERRDQSLDNGLAIGIPAEEVLQQIRASLPWKKLYFIP